ncbi:MAG: hypothetical protein INQ03_00115 [Candidatus Heimdallarchaeota archaeon]|nr:hypothetical protein [Candidatus Heimdallarchaeota archaeon]
MKPGKKGQGKKKKPEKKSNAYHKQRRLAKKDMEKTIPSEEIDKLLRMISKEKQMFEKKREEIYHAFEEQYTQDEFYEDAELVYTSLQEPVLMSYWTLYPKNMLAIMRNSQADRIIEGMKYLAQLTEDQEDIFMISYPSEVPDVIFYSFDEYTHQIQKIQTSVEKKIGNNIDDLINLSEKFVDELTDIIQKPWEEVVLSHRLDNEQSLLFYAISILLFQDILLYQREENSKEMVEGIISQMLSFAKENQLSKVVEIIMSY